MTKNDLINDMNFRHKCCTYGLDWNDFYILDDIIILSSPKQNIFVLFDENYNVIGIYDKNDEINKSVPAEKRLREMKEIYENTYVKLPYPFQNFSLKQIVELAKRVCIHASNHGHSSYVVVNGELVSDEYDGVCIALLSYVEFLGQQIEQYFMNLYQMKMMGFKYPDIYTYITSMMHNIEECIDINIENNNRPFPIDIIKYLGQDRKNEEKYCHELYRIIDLLLMQKGLKIKGGFEHYRELEPTEKDTTDLSDVSMKLLKLLEISDETVEPKSQESDKTLQFTAVKADK